MGRNSMKIDLFTFFAQIVNFIILVALLNKFFFKAVKTAMDKRERGISENIAAAQKSKKDAAELVAQSIVAKKEIEEKRNEMLAKARAAAEDEKQQLISAAKNDVRKTRQIWLDDVEDEKQRFLEALRVKSGDFVCLLADKVLKDLSGVELEKRISSVFVEKIHALENSKAAGWIKTGSQLKVISSFELSDDNKKKISDEVEEKFGCKTIFEKQTGAHCGIELKFDGYRISWSIEDYLKELEEELEGVFIHPKEI